VKPERDEEIRLCITGWQREEAIGWKSDWRGGIDRRNNVYTVTKVLHTFADKVIKGCEVKKDRDTEILTITDVGAFISSIDEILLESE